MKSICRRLSWKCCPIASDIRKNKACEGKIKNVPKIRISKLQLYIVQYFTTFLSQWTLLTTFILDLGTTLKKWAKVNLNMTPWVVTTAFILICNNFAMHFDLYYQSYYRYYQSINFNLLQSKLVIENIFKLSSHLSKHLIAQMKFRNKKEFF